MFERVVGGRRGMLAVALATLAIAALPGCSGMGPDGETESMAKQAYQHLVRNEDAALEAMLVPAARGPGNAKVYAAMRGLIPAEAPASVTQTNWQSYAGTNGRRVSFQHAYAYSDRTVVASTVLVSPLGSGGWKLLSFNVNIGPGGKPPTAAPAKAA